MLVMAKWFSPAVTWYLLCTKPSIPQYLTISSAHCGKELNEELTVAIRLEATDDNNLWAFTHYTCYTSITGNSRVSYDRILYQTKGVMYDDYLKMITLLIICRGTKLEVMIKRDHPFEGQNEIQLDFPDIQAPVFEYNQPIPNTEHTGPGKKLKRRSHTKMNYKSKNYANRQLGLLTQAVSTFSYTLGYSLTS